MIVSMIKVTFVGLESEKEDFLRRLQDVGITHLIFPDEPREPAALARELHRVVETRKFLARRRPKGTPDATPDAGGLAARRGEFLARKRSRGAAAPALDAAAICARREELGREDAALHAEILALKKQRALAEPWGDFSVEDVRALEQKGLRVQLFRVPRRVLPTLPLAGVFHQAISERGSDVFLATFSPTPVSLGIPEEKLPDRNVVEIDREIAVKQARLQEIEEEYRALAADLETLEKTEATLTDVLAFQRAAENAREELDNRLFILRCWSPVPEEELMRRIGGRFNLYHYSDKPKEHERIPVKLENPPVFNAGEDLVKIYSYPSHRDFDPSAFVLYSFAVFFGMIVGDFGYGLVLLGLTVWLRRKVQSRSPLAQRMFRMMYMLTASVLVWGVIGAGFFGITLDPDNPLVRMSLLDYNSQQGQKEIMVISILIGMTHICLSLLIKFTRHGGFSWLGWIVAIWSGYFFLNSRMAHGEENPLAMYGLLTGLAVVFLFSSKSRNPLIRLVEGVQGLLEVVQIFSDVLSYLRLFALGVATVYIAQTFNILAGSVSGSVPVLGYVLAAVILLIGHTVNIALAIMGGVIHGLRLNFLEWYRWSFEGDGLEYKPFQRIAS